METLVYMPPASIEAEKADAITRKIIQMTPVRNPKLACIIFPFKLDRNCEIIISKELDPKEPKIDNNSLLNLGDGLKGDMIYGFSEKSVPSPDVKKGSSTHKASFLTIKNFVFARLEKPFKALEDQANRTSIAS